MEIVTAIFDVIADVVTNLVTTIGNALTAMTSLFYNAESGFTFVGVLLLITVGTSLVWGAWALIKNLISQRVN